MNNLDFLFLSECQKQCPKNQSGVPVYFKENAVLAIPDRDDKKISKLSDVLILNSKFDGKTLKFAVLMI